MSKTCPSCLKNGLKKTKGNFKVWSCIKCGFWSQDWYKGMKFSDPRLKYGLIRTGITN